jgi:RHS repeat-associated protein
LNFPPVITSTPVLTVATGANPTNYTYQVIASDPDAGDRMSYSVTTVPAVSLSVDPNSGRISWTVPANYVPAGLTGSVQVTLRVTDSGNPQRYAEQNYTLVVRNLPPTLAQITPQPIKITAGNPFRLDLQGSSPDHDTLTYTVTGDIGTVVPPGLTVDTLGRVRWTDTGLGQHNTVTYNFIATVRDSYGASASQPFTLEVDPDTQAPVVQLEVQDDPGWKGRSNRFRVAATDNLGVVDRKLEVSGDNGNTWQVIGLDRDGVGRWTPTATGVYLLRAWAWDAAGNGTTAPAVTRSLQVFDPNATGTPTVTLTVPASGTKVTTLTPVTGTITDNSGLYSWSLDYAPADGSAGWQNIAGASNPPLGTTSVTLPPNTSFDPTLLGNGAYVLRLSGTNVGRNTATATQTVQVDGRLKLGNLTFSATDLTIPVAGIPITIGRTYDSANAKRKGDFGYGWKLTLGGYSTTVDPATTAPSFLNTYPTFRAATTNTPATHVYVKRPDGGVDGYTFTPVPAEVLFSNVLSWYPAFTPDDPSVLNALVADQIPLILIDSTGELIDYALGGYNPANPSFGGAFDIVEYGGLKHEVDARTGQQLSIRDRNENKLTFTGDAIVSNRGIQVTFQRDAQGRIIAAQDPRGNRVRYRYNPQGDLVEVTDRANVVMATYSYRTTDPLHYLTGVTDANGTRALTASYYTNVDPTSPLKNRLQSLTDATGQTATATNYTVSATGGQGQLSVPKPSGGTTTNQVSYDAWGNPVDVIQALQSPDQTESQTTYADAVQQRRGTPNQVVQKGPGFDVTTTLAYDNFGNVTTSTDTLGGVSRITYDQQGDALTASDPLGNTTSNAYDDKGNLLATYSPQGVGSTFAYDSRGLVTQVTRGQATTLMGYDPIGRLTSQTTPTQVQTSFSYDANGNQKGSSFTWVNPNPPNDQHTLTTDVTYDANDRAVQSHDTRGNLSQTVYDRLGRAVQTIDARGAVSGMVYDIRGLVVETDNADGTVVRTTYDALGRSEWVTDAFVPGTPTRGTKTVYDEQGRVVRTERYADVVIELRGSGGSTQAVFVSAGGPPLSVSTTAYDSLGRVTQASSTGGATVNSFYDNLGRQIHTESWDSALTTKLTESWTSYDAAGRAVTSTDALMHVTRTDYDGDGGAVATYFADNTTTRVEYDSLGRKKADIDQLGRRTEYGYDAQGRLTAVRQPAVPDPLNGGMLTVPVTSYGYDVYGNHSQTTDARTRVTRWTFDQFGQELTRTLPDVPSQQTATETSTYNSFGQLLTHTDFNGQVAKYFYDTDPGRADPQHPSLRLGRLTALEYYVSASATTPAETVQYRYDDHGQRNKVIDSVAGTTIYTCDTEGRLLRVQGPAGLAQTLNYAYDPGTSRLTETRTDQSDIQYGYDPLGRLKTVTLTKRNGTMLANPEQTGYIFDIAGNLTSITQQVGATVVLTATLGYDTLNRLTSRVNKDRNNNLLSSFTYTRLADGSIGGLAETVKQPTGTSVNTTTTYTYDALNRLTHEQVSHDQNPDYTTDYTLDLVGNRTKKLTTKGDGTVQRVEGTFDARDRLTQELVYNVASGGTPINTITYIYDTNGSLTNRSATAGDSLTQVWDVRGRLQSATTVQGTTTTQGLYRYDPDGIRLREEVTTITNGVPSKDVRLLVVDQQSPTGYAEIIEERPENAQLGITSYVYGSSLEPISMARPSQPVGLYVADVHSGVRQVVDPSGANVLATYRYDAFGNMTTSAGTFVSIVGYRGDRVSPVTGNINLRDRDYDPRTDRFTSTDPVITSEFRHSYLYGSADPLNRLDPSGQFDVSLGSLTISISIRAGLKGAVTGALFGGLTNGIDNLLGDKSFWEGFASGAWKGGIFGLFLGGASPTLSKAWSGLSHSTQLLFKWAILAGVAEQTIEGVLDSSNWYQGSFRLFAGAVSIWGLQRFLKACFVAGTPILTPTGEQTIESLRPGDLVLSRSEHDRQGVVVPRRVEEVFVREARIAILKVGGQDIGTTEEHPVWVEGKGWRMVKELQVGDRLTDHEGNSVLLEAIRATATTTRVYNVRVAEFSTYFVGSREWGFSVWAHNADYQPSLFGFDVDPSVTVPKGVRRLAVLIHSTLAPRLKDLAQSAVAVVEAYIPGQGSRYLLATSGGTRMTKAAEKLIKGMGVDVLDEPLRDAAGKTFHAEERIYSYLKRVGGRVIRWGISHASDQANDPCSERCAPLVAKLGGIIESD